MVGPGQCSAKLKDCPSGLSGTPGVHRTLEPGLFDSLKMAREEDLGTASHGQVPWGPRPSHGFSGKGAAPPQAEGIRSHGWGFWGWIWGRSSTAQLSLRRGAAKVNRLPPNSEGDHWGARNGWALGDGGRRKGAHSSMPSGGAGEGLPTAHGVGSIPDKTEKALCLKGWGMLRVGGAQNQWGGGLWAWLRGPQALALEPRGPCVYSWRPVSPQGRESILTSNQQWLTHQFTRNEGG